MKGLLLLCTLCALLTLQSCGSFKAKRVSADEADELAMEITDKWVDRDTEIVIKKTLKQIAKHRGFNKFLKKLGREPKLFISEVQNMTSEPYFPIADMNDEMLNEFSASGEYVLIESAKRDALLKEITYQNDGMVSTNEAKQIGQAAGADLMIFGSVRMKPESRGGKTIKQYSVNFRMVDIQRGVQVLRTRQKIKKFSDQDSSAF
jgi:penicillin-binding protein activator